MIQILKFISKGEKRERTALMQRPNPSLHLGERRSGGHDSIRPINTHGGKHSIAVRNVVPLVAGDRHDHGGPQEHAVEGQGAQQHLGAMHAVVDVGCMDGVGCVLGRCEHDE